MSYWCNSNFADILRGTTKLKYGTDVEWRKWNIMAKQSHPFRYWLTETVLDKIDTAVHWPYNSYRDFMYYIRFRFVRKTHSMSTNELKGHYNSFESKLFLCLFNELIDFVEIDCAAQENRESRSKLPFFKYFIVNRDPNAGIEYLKWMIENNPHKAKETRTIIELYNWFKHSRATRKDPYADLHQFETAEDFLSTLFNADPALADLRSAAYNLSNQYIQEDDEMLLKLISIKEEIWV